MPPAVRRFNPWPFGIVAAFVVFIGATIALIVVASADRSDLVAPDYYEQELRYQQRIDQLARTLPWESRIDVAYRAADGRIDLALPAEHAALGATGRVELYRPSEAGQDQAQALRLDGQGRQSLPAGDLRPGLWRVRLRWKVGGDDFYADRPLVIPSGDPAPASGGTP